MRVTNINRISIHTCQAEWKLKILPRTGWIKVEQCGVEARYIQISGFRTVLRGREFTFWGVYSWICRSAGWRFSFRGNFDHGGTSHLNLISTGLQEAYGSLLSSSGRLSTSKISARNWKIMATLLRYCTVLHPSLQMLAYYCVCPIGLLS